MNWATVPLGPDLRERLARERYYGYIACTRASEKLVVTFSRSDADGKTLNPSPFVAHLQTHFSGARNRGIFETKSNWPKPNTRVKSCATHLNSGIQNLRPKLGRTAAEFPRLRILTEKSGALREPDAKENLSPALAEKLYGPTLRSSVSRLEEFAACPFRFFVRVGLRADERKVFELDARERGNFQHDVLKIFHEQLSAEGKRWRDFDAGGSP